MLRSVMTPSASPVTKPIWSGPFFMARTTVWKPWATTLFGSRMESIRYSRGNFAPAAPRYGPFCSAARSTAWQATQPCWVNRRWPFFTLPRPLRAAVATTLASSWAIFLPLLAAASLPAASAASAALIWMTLSPFMPSFSCLSKPVRPRSVMAWKKPMSRGFLSTWPRTAFFCCSLVSGLLRTLSRAFHRIVEAASSALLAIVRSLFTWLPRSAS